MKKVSIKDLTKNATIIIDSAKLKHIKGGERLVRSKRKTPIE